MDVGCDRYFGSPVTIHTWCFHKRGNGAIIIMHELICLYLRSKPIGQGN